MIDLVANAEGESAAIAPNTWIEIKGTNLAKAGSGRICRSSDFAGKQMPTYLDGVSVKVNGKAAYVYYIGPTQVNVLTPPERQSPPPHCSSPLARWRRHSCPHGAPRT